jgi:hypothetical protein
MRLAPTAPETTTTATPEAWVDVLAGLTGLRLHALEELLVAGEATGEELAGRVVDWARRHGGPKLRAAAGAPGAVEQALQWLGHHRLAQQGGSGRWRGRHPSQAMMLFLTRGPDRAHTFTLGGSLAAQEGRGDRRSQAQERHAEAAKGDTPAPPRPPEPPRRPVHAAQFFDFGDY